MNIEKYLERLWAVTLTAITACVIVLATFFCGALAAFGVAALYHA